MISDIYDPLTEYANVFRDRFDKVAQDTFAELVSESGIDIAANRETCRQLHSVEKDVSATGGRIDRWKALCIFLWLLVAASIVAILVWSREFEPWAIASLAVLAISLVAVLLANVHPALKEFKGRKEQLEAEAKKLETDAWNQMAPLNSLYDWDVLTRMMTRTVPRLEFDPYFTTQRLADLKATYGWDDSFNADRSVIYSHSGLINGNPFVICRTRKMRMGRRTYTGSITIYWTTHEVGSDGKYHTVSHSQALTATVTAPFPEYSEKTRLIYGSTAAPDLVFSRRHSGLADREHSASYRMELRSLRRKARNLKTSDFAMMTNEEFEVAFNTSDRNNNQQFALLFTPLAQESMLKLLKDHKEGYGDDFDFIKNKMVNMVIADHMQSMDLDMDPGQYRNYEYDKAKADFLKINARCFRAIYFCLAPLLCVPMYQQIRPQSAIYGHDMMRRSAFWEHEALANYWGQGHFRHPDCVTDCILKTREQEDADCNRYVAVSAHGFRVEKRVTYIGRFGGDGRWHNVPVYWDEYLPVTGEGRMAIMEDNDFNDSHATQTERIEHIDEMLESTRMTLYRRHIASKI